MSDRLAREAFKAMLGGGAGGAAFKIIQQVNSLESWIQVMLIFGVVIVAFHVAEVLYGQPESADTDEPEKYNGPAS